MRSGSGGSDSHYQGDNRRPLPTPTSPPRDANGNGANSNNNVSPTRQTSVSSTASSGSKLSFKKLSSKKSQESQQQQYQPPPQYQQQQQQQQQQHQQLHPGSVPYESISTRSKSPIPVNYLPANGDHKRSAEARHNSSFAPATLISGPIPPLPPHRMHNQPPPNTNRYAQPRQDPRGSQYSQMDDNASVYSFQSHQSQLPTPPPPPPPEKPDRHEKYESKFDPRTADYRESSQSQPSQASQARGYTNSVYSVASSSRSLNQGSKSSHRKSKSIENNNNNTNTSDSSKRSSYSPSTDNDDAASMVSKSSKHTINAMVQANEFSLERPKDDAMVDQMFLELMNKRDFKSLPEAAKKQMLSYPISKKWMLIHQDALTEFQNEKKRSQATKTDENTPEWYVRKLMDNSISAKQLGNLWVSLRTEPVGWVQGFIDHQGQVALSTVLSQINNRSSWSDDVLDREYDLVKCFKALLNLKDGADHAIQSTKCVPALVRSLVSPRLASRKLVTDVLTFLAHWQEPFGHDQVLNALDYMKGHMGDIGRFEAWMRTVEQTLDGRGKLGSMVGASEEYRTGGVGMESLLMEYALATLFLVNVIVLGSPDLKVRVHLRSQLKASGLPRIAAKMQQFNYEHINEQIRKYDEAAALDYEDLLNIEREEDIKDMDDPNEIVHEIWGRVKGTSAEGFFLSAMQHFLLVREDPSDEGARMFQLVDALMSHVVMDRIMPDVDLSNILNFSVQHILDRLQTDDQAKRAQIESKEAYKQVQESKAERERMQHLVNLGADGMVGRLQKQLDEANEMLKLQRRVNDNLSNELEEIKQGHVVELQNQELEIRELYMMLKEGKKLDGSEESTEDSGIIDRERLASKLEAQLARKKTEYKLEGRAYGVEVEPTPQLRALRDKMEALQLEARELEVFDFEDIDEKKEGEPVDQFAKSLPEDARKDLYEQKMLRLKRLQELQQFSSDAARDFAALEEEGELDVKKTRRRGTATAHRKTSVPVSDDDAKRLADTSSRVFSEEYNPVTQKATLVTVGKPKEKVPGRSQSETAQPQTLPYLEEITRKVSKLRGVDEDEEEEEEDEEEDDVKVQDVTVKDKDDENVKDETTNSKEVDDKDEEKEAKFDGPPPPPPPPPPEPTSTGGFTGGPPPPPPPPPPPGFNGAPPPPPPPPPGFSGAPPPPPPPPPPPGSGPGTPIPAAPPLPGFATPGAPSTPQIPGSPQFSLGIRPKRKLKQMHWEKLDAVDHTVWAGNEATLADELHKKGVFEEVERIFAAKEIKQFMGKKKKQEEEKVSFLARDVSQQFGINLHQFGSLSVDELVLKVLMCSDEVLENQNVLEFFGRQELTEVTINMAKNFQPYSTDYTRDEESREKPEKDPAELARADHIYLELCYNLQHYWKARTRALTMVTTYQKEYHDLVAKLRQIDNACERVRESKHLKEVLEIILAVGNYMNDSSKQASGFKLGTLQRLVFTKDEKNTMTFLHYVEKIIRNNFGHLEQFTEDLKETMTVAKMSMEQLKTDCQDFMQNIKNVQTSVDFGNLSDPTKFHPNDQILSVVFSALPEARQKREYLDDQLKTTMADFNKLMKYFGEDPNDSTAVGSFFSKLSFFVTEYQRAKSENLLREQEDRAYAARKRMVEAPKKTNALASGDLSVASSPTTAASSPAQSNSVMDNLLEKLKAAGPSGDARSARRRANARRNMADHRRLLSSSNHEVAEIMAKNGEGEQKDGEEAVEEEKEKAAGEKHDGADSAGGVDGGSAAAEEAPTAAPEQALQPAAKIDELVEPAAETKRGSTAGSESHEEEQPQRRTSTTTAATTDAPPQQEASSGTTTTTTTEPAEEDEGGGEEEEDVGGRARKLLQELRSSEGTSPVKRNSAGGNSSSSAATSRLAERRARKAQQMKDRGSEELRASLRMSTHSAAQTRDDSDGDAATRNADDSINSSAPESPPHAESNGSVAPSPDQASQPEQHNDQHDETSTTHESAE